MEKHNSEKYPAAQYDKSGTDIFLQSRVYQDLKGLSQTITSLEKAAKSSPEDSAGLEAEIERDAGTRALLYKIENIWPVFIHYASDWHPETEPPEKFKKRFEEALAEDSDLGDVLVMEFINAVVKLPELDRMDRENKLRVLTVAGKAMTMLKVLRKGKNFLLDDDLIKEFNRVRDEANDKIRNLST